MQIVQAPDPVLSQKAKKIGKIDKSIRDLIDEMKKTLVSASDPEGIGLAAPQVGKSVQLFITKPEKDVPFQVFINPTLHLVNEEKHTPTETKKKGKTRLEGCLSLKDIWGTVSRSPKVKMTYTDEEGVTQTKVFTGFFATILQHEYDHLEGILFPKRVLEQKGNLYKSYKDEDGEDVFEPLKL